MKMTVVRGGMRYTPDLKKLSNAFPVNDLTEGLTISHDQLQDVLGITRGPGRYYALVNSWIKQQLNENDIRLAWEPTIGIKVLTPAEFFHASLTGVRHAYRQVARKTKRLGYTQAEKLDQTDKEMFYHASKVARVVQEAVTIGTKQLAVPLSPVESLPKPRLKTIGA